MKVFNSTLAAIGLATFVFASCSDSNSDGPSTNPDILDATTIGLTLSDAASLAASVTNYKTSATAGARHFSRAIDENLFNGLLTMETIPTRPNTGVGEVGNESTKLQNDRNILCQLCSCRQQLHLCGIRSEPCTGIQVDKHCKVN